MVPGAWDWQKKLSLHHHPLKLQICWNYFDMCRSPLHILAELICERCTLAHQQLQSVHSKKFRWICPKRFNLKWEQRPQRDALNFVTIFSRSPFFHSLSSQHHFSLSCFSHWNRSDNADILGGNVWVHICLRSPINTSSKCLRQTVFAWLSTCRRHRIVDVIAVGACVVCGPNDILSGFVLIYQVN